MIKVEVRGSFKNAQTFLQRMKKREQFRVLEKYGPIGVAALKAATPEDSSETANAWSYEIIDRPGYFRINWRNAHMEKPGHSPIAILLHYGHATRNGGYVHGLDYINPALKPIFKQMADDMWREVTK